VTDGVEEPLGCYAKKEAPGTAGSRCPIPSGIIPDDEVVGCAVMQRFGGEGAGPDGVSLSIFRVFSAKSVNLIVFSYFLLVFDVICCPIDDLE
jgi:hypothetical protein